MKRRKWILVICIAMGIIALLMGTAAVTSMMGYGVSVGKLYFTESSTYLIDGTTSIIVSDQSRKSDLFDGYTNGDEIILVHDGVEETFPARTGGYMAIRISKGDGTYKPSDDLLGIAVLEEFDEAYVNQKLEYRAQYIRTNGYTEAFEYPSIRIMDSQQDLSDYYNTWHEVFDLERREQVYSDSTIGFLDACDRYDEAFFETHYLIFVLLEEPSGSIRHQVQSVEQTQDEKLSISIDHQVPEACTDDMAQWHIILELSREDLVESPDDVELYVYGIQYAYNAIPVVPQTEGAFQQPPEGTLLTPDGDFELVRAGYSWNCTLANGLVQATEADQASRPPENLMPVVISKEYAETVYAPVPGGDAYAPTNSLGYLVKLDWEAAPSSVTYTAWDKNGSVEQQVISHQDYAFYAKQGGYIYEITATWEDTGAGYHGTANYYVYITDDDTHLHMTALTPQIVENPVTGYCGNTQTRLYIDGKEYWFMYGYSVTLSDLLVNLDYDPGKVCRCMAQYTADTEFGTNYQIHLDYGFVRCDLGQADLTQDQIQTIADIINWAETTNCQYPIDD